MWMITPLDEITYILYVRFPDPGQVLRLNFMQIYYFDEILYNFVIPMTKISILCFYLRIFPQRRFKICAYILIATNIGYLIAFELVTIFQCTPIYLAWDNWDGTQEGTCRDVTLQAWVAAAVSIVLDVATIALPMPELWKLNLSIWKKVQVMLMFAVGLLSVFPQDLGVTVLTAPKA
jgi:hypothetical protein